MSTFFSRSGSSPTQQRKKPTQRLFTSLVGLPAESITPEAPAKPPIAKLVETQRSVVGDGWGRGDGQRQRPLTAEENALILEERTRRQFGLSPARPIESDTLTINPLPPRGVSGLREALQLDRQDIVDLFDKIVHESVRFTEVERSIENAVLENRIARLRKIVQASKERIDSWSVRIMKIRREEADILDKATREKFKREENARVARCNMKLARYRAALRSGGYKESVWRYALVPTYFRDIIDDKMTFVEWGEAKYIDGEQKSFQGLPTHVTTELVQESTSVSSEYNLALYRQVLLLDADALHILGKTESEQKQSWANWRKWEDTVIGTAIRCGILRVNPELARALGLTTELVLDEVEADTTEDALAIKTGGACYGGRIKSAGVRFRNGRFVQRRLESFDKAKPSGIQDGMEWESYDSSSDPTSDDCESYMPD